MNPNIEQRKNRWNYWQMLKAARKEFMENSVEFDAYVFEDYIETKYGIRMNTVNGNITDGYVIIDEKNI
jgi:hypothetical protein